MNPDIGYTTNPLRVGAPLPEEMTSILKAVPGTIDIDAELIRAQVELMHAIARHRKGWSKMRQIKAARELQAAEKGIPAYLDNDAIWKEVTADVRWWREEMAAQATVIQALLAIRDVPVARTHQEAPPHNVRETAWSKISPSVRETAWSWEPDSTPTPEQVAAARIWMRLSAADLDHAGRMRGEDWAHCKLLLIRHGAA